MDSFFTRNGTLLPWAVNAPTNVSERLKAWRISKKLHGNVWKRCPTFSQEYVHMQKMPPWVSAVDHQQSSSDYKSVSELLFVAGSQTRDHSIWQVCATEMMEPVTDQLLGPVLERQDLFDDRVRVYLKCGEDILNALLKGRKRKVKICIFYRANRILCLCKYWWASAADKYLQSPLTNVFLLNCNFSQMLSGAA